MKNNKEKSTEKKYRNNFVKQFHARLHATFKFDRFKLAKYYKNRRNHHTNKTNGIKNKFSRNKKKLTQTHCEKVSKI